MMNTMTFYITDRVVAQMDIDIAIAHQPGAMESAARQLARAVVAEAESIGGMPGDDDFFVEVGAGGNFTRVITSTWSPIRALFIGGPNDGDVAPAVREGWQAVPIWRTRGLPQAPQFESGDHPTRPSSTFTYVLAGIDGMRSMWAYEFEPDGVSA